jgi:hypothetical protein
MKITFLKAAITSSVLFLAIMVTANPASAQQDNIVNAPQGDQLFPQTNASGTQNSQFEARNKHRGAQNKQHDDQHKNIEAQRVAFITQELNLTPDEAKVFWPVYNEYEAKRHELRKSFRNPDDFHKQDIDKLTDKEATQILDNQIIEAQKFLDLRKEYHTKFKSVLPAIKVLKLYDAEREFQKMLIDKIREHNQSPPPANKK